MISRLWLVSFWSSEQFTGLEVENSPPPPPPCMNRVNMQSLTVIISVMTPKSFCYLLPGAIIPRLIVHIVLPTNRHFQAKALVITTDLNMAYHIEYTFKKCFPFGI